MFVCRSEDRQHTEDATKKSDRRNSDEDEERVETFLRAIRRAFFHDEENTPRASVTLNSFAR